MIVWGDRHMVEEPFNTGRRICRLQMPQAAHFTLLTKLLLIIPEEHSADVYKILLNLLTTKINYYKAMDVNNKPNAKIGQKTNAKVIRLPFLIT